MSFFRSWLDLLVDPAGLLEHELQGVYRWAADDEAGLV